MILGIEIALVIIGLLALVRGRMTVTASRVVEGIPARLLGLLALTPIPIAFRAHCDSAPTPGSTRRTG